MKTFFSDMHEAERVKICFVYNKRTGWSSVHFKTLPLIYSDTALQLTHSSGVSIDEGRICYTSTPLLLSNPTFQVHLLPVFAQIRIKNNYNKFYLWFSGFTFLVQVFSFCVLLFIFLWSTAVTAIIIGTFCFGAILVDLEFKHIIITLEAWTPASCTVSSCSVKQGPKFSGK